ncbi:energy transducer TonB [Actimicrobium sp. CCI2.3]|uniref:energy transducer TonB n=1 Tax=Actimicrobium sp. CCI2.3 TaxID=3048616 RepID=UPI002AB3B086|nr:energy transducer TonB [Actimicrobium sp. CCI2.3]MDY7576217.1 energy transducer TonB [Actimicrobium sp. CCI2.3]MEB0020578.1 energy transducer TonB [Actimicrobium sp. CCI2.3]
MDFSQKERNPAKKFGGLAAVILLHLFIVYALVSGLARKAVEVITQPVETKLIEEIKPPPPPPNLPPPPPPPKMVAPPPPFIPPPEIQINTPPPPVNTITAVSNVKPDNPVMPAPSAPVAAAPAPSTAPAGPPVVVAGINDLNSCKPDYPRASLIAEETGVTRVEFTVSPTGQMLDAKVKKTSGSRNLDRAAVAGLSRCKFNPGTQDGKAVQSTFSVEYVWKLDN